MRPALAVLAVVAVLAAAARWLGREPGPDAPAVSAPAESRAEDAGAQAELVAATENEPHVPTFTVRTVDALTREPRAGVTVAVGFFDGEHVSDSAEATTDAVGRAELTPKLLSTAPVVRWHVFAKLLGTTHVGADVLLAGDAAPPEEVVLALPPVAPVEITVLDAAGERVDGASVSLSQDLFSLSMRGERVASRAVSPMQFAFRETEDGVARFEALAVGSPLSASTAHPEGGPGVNEEFVLDGPTELTLRLEDPVAVLVGRLLEVDGEPVTADPDRRCVWAVFRPGDDPVRLYEGTLEFAAGGGFRLRLHPDPPDAELPPADWIVVRRDPPGAVRARLPNGLAVGEHDLGDVTLAAPELVLAGTVVDDSGAPVENAYVHPSRPYRRGWTRHFGSVPLLGGGRTDAEGAFEIRGHSLSPEPTWHVDVRKEDYRSVGPSEFEPGTRDAEYVLPRGGRLAGALLQDDLPSELRGPFGSVRVALEPMAGTDAEPLDLVEGVVVPETGTVIDPRTAVLDARGARPLTIHVRDAAGEPVAFAYATVADAAPPHFHQTASRHDGRRTLLTHRDRLDLRVEAHSLRATVVRGVEDGATVVLGEGLPVVIAWPGAPDLPDRSEMVVDVENPAGRPVVSRAPQVGANGSRHPVREPGRHRATLGVVATDAQGFTNHEPFGDPVEFEVREGSEPPRVEFTTDPALAIECAHALLEERP